MLRFVAETQPHLSPQVDLHPLAFDELAQDLLVAASSTYLPGGTGSTDAVPETVATSVPSSMSTLLPRPDAPFTAMTAGLSTLCSPALISTLRHSAPANVMVKVEGRSVSRRACLSGQQEGDEARPLQEEA